MRAALWTASQKPEALAAYVALATQLAEEYNRVAEGYAQAGA